MAQQASSLDPYAAIKEEVSAICEAERLRFASGANQDAEPIQSADILRALDRNQDGGADLFLQKHRNRLVFEHPAGQWLPLGGDRW
nr:hypothetical protein [Deltaproteobacteria bacterium]